MTQWGRRASDRRTFQDALVRDVPVLLRAARYIGGKSQRELAERAGVDRSVVARIEAGAVQAPGFLVVVELLNAAGCSLRVLDESGEPLVERPHEDALDAGRRHWPAHLSVRQVHDDGDWWYGVSRPADVPLPKFTADWERLRGRPRARRRTKAQRAADEAARNTPQGGQVSDGDAAAG